MNGSQSETWNWLSGPFGTGGFQKSVTGTTASALCLQNSEGTRFGARQSTPPAILSLWTESHVGGVSGGNFVPMGFSGMSRMPFVDNDPWRGPLIREIVKASKLLWLPLFQLLLAEQKVERWWPKQLLPAIKYSSSPAWFHATVRSILVVIPLPYATSMLRSPIAASRKSEGWIRQARKQVSVPKMAWGMESLGAPRQLFCSSLFTVQILRRVWRTFYLFIYLLFTMKYLLNKKKKKNCLFEPLVTNARRNMLSLGNCGNFQKLETTPLQSLLFKFVVWQSAPNHSDGDYLVWLRVLSPKPFCCRSLSFFNLFYFIFYFFKNPCPLIKI